jgi:hypothetical protein
MQLSASKNKGGGKGKPSDSTMRLRLDDIRFSQASIHHTFSNGDSIYKKNAMPANVEVVKVGGVYWTMNNRRLFNLKYHLGGKTFVTASLSDDNNALLQKLTTQNGGRSVSVRGQLPVVEWIGGSVCDAQVDLDEIVKCDPLDFLTIGDTVKAVAALTYKSLGQSIGEGCLGTLVSLDDAKKSLWTVAWHPTRCSPRICTCRPPPHPHAFALNCAANALLKSALKALLRLYFVDSYNLINAAPRAAVWVPYKRTVHNSESAPVASFSRSATW